MKMIFMVAGVATVIVACTSLVKSDRFPATATDDLWKRQQVVATHVGAKSRKDAPTFMMTRAQVELMSKRTNAILGTNNHVASLSPVAGQPAAYLNSPNRFREASKGESDRQPGMTEEMPNGNKKGMKASGPLHAVLNKEVEAPFNFRSDSPSELTKNKKFSLAPPLTEAKAKALAKQSKQKARRPQQYTNCLASYDDYYEPNDYRSSAEPITEGQWLYYKNGFGAQFDDDWYEIYVPNSYRDLTLDARFSDDCGDIDMDLYDSDGDLLASSTSSTDDEYISISLSRGGYYYVKMRYGNRGNKYDLKYTTSYTWSSTYTDFYEPNDSMGQAYNLSAWENGWLSNLHGYGTANTDDYYAVDVSATNLNITLDLRFTEGDLDMYFYNSSGSRIGISNSSYSTSEYINVTVPNAGRYYVLIKPFGSTTGQEYDFKWSSRRTAPTFTEDFYEPNNSLSTATLINAGTVTSANQFNEDWYRVYVPAGMRILSAHMTFTNSYGDLDLQLLDANGTEIRSSFGNGDSEHIDMTVPTPNQYYYLRVFGDNMGNPYQLTVNLASSGPEDDAYEMTSVGNNNTLQNAYDLSASENIWLSNLRGQGVQKNEDFYKILMPPHLKKITVDMRFVYPAGVTGSLIDVDLLDANGQTVARSRSEKKNEMIELYLENSGVYYLRVYGNNMAVPYDLRWSASPMNLPATAPAGQVNVFEFYNTKLKRYFISSRPNEIALLDQYRDATDWYRTGYYFRSYANLSGGLSPVCRFFIPEAATHFYGMSQADCDLVRPIAGFQDEGIDFYIKGAVNGQCAEGELKIYRLFNNRAIPGEKSDGNHRYTTSQLEIDRMLSLSWVNEGVVGCSPPL